MKATGISADFGGHIMKNRKWLTNVFYVIILLSLLGFLLLEFNIFGLEAGIQKWAASGLLALAIISVALVELVFPVASNRDMLKNQKYVVLVIVKSVLFIASAAVLFMYEPFGVIKNMPVALVAFIVLYFIQFFITLDPKAEDLPVQTSRAGENDNLAELTITENRRPESDEIDEKVLDNIDDSFVDDFREFSSNADGKTDGSGNEDSDVGIIFDLDDDTEELPMN